MTDPTTRSDEVLVGALLRLAKREDRGALAALRRSLAPDSVALAYPYVVPFLPREGGPWTERIYLLVAGLFALHPAQGAPSLGTAMRLVGIKSDSSSIERRFVALLDSHPDDLEVHLRHAIALVRSCEIALDWNDLLRTLLRWRFDSSRRRWAHDFWAGATPNEGEPE